MDAAAVGSITDRERDGIVLRLVGQMGESGSWGGETHIQKSVFFLQSLLGISLGYRFVLHLHGPYSFELRDDLTRLRARNKLALKLNPGYGPSLRLDRDIDVAGLPGEESKNTIGFVAEYISTRTVRDLERVATAYFLLHVKETPVPDTSLPEELRRLKPHITEEESALALDEVQKLVDGAKEAASTPRS